MNVYEIAYRNKGRLLDVYRRCVIADSLELAVRQFEEATPMEPHEEYVSVVEVAQNVLLGMADNAQRANTAKRVQPSPKQ